MNILLLCNCPIDESQGSGYVIVNTIRALESYSHVVDAIPPSSLLIFPSLYGKGQIYRMAVGMALWVLKHKNTFSRYQLIIVYGAESSLAVYILKKILKVKIPIILHSNGIELHVEQQLSIKSKYLNEKRKWYHFSKSILYKYCYYNAEAIITVSKFDHDFALDKLKIKGSNVFYNEPCLPDIYFSYDFSKVVKKKIIAFCGSWIDRKGIQAIKVSIPAILRKFPDYTFRIIGVGDNFRPEEHFPPDIINKVEIFPFVKGKERLMKLYAESSILLFPSLYESFGLVMAEAMFCGCAVISGTTGYAATVKNNEEAIILQEPDAQNLYDALVKLIVDDKFRESLSSNARKTVKNLKWKIYNEKLNHILDTVVNLPA